MLPAESVLRRFVQAKIAASGEHAGSGPPTPLWSGLALRLAQLGTRESVDLAHQLLAQTTAATSSPHPAQAAQLGEAARTIFRWSRSAGVLDWFRGRCAELVCRTFETEPSVSEALLRECITPESLRADGYEVLRRIAESVPQLVATAPQFVRDLYVAAFTFREESQESTHLGGTVMRLSSNRKQDYELGLYLLKKHFPRFLAENLFESTAALVTIVEVYISREHSPSVPEEAQPFSLGNMPLRLVRDWSSIWESTYTTDEALEMLTMWEGCVDSHIRDGRTKVGDVLRHVSSGTGYAVFWRRILRIAARSPQSAGLQLTELLFCVPILSSFDTHEPAMQFLSSVFPHLSVETRTAVEHLIVRIADPIGDQTLSAQQLQRRMLDALGKVNIVTPEAAQCLAALPQLEAKGSNSETPRSRRRYVPNSSGSGDQEASAISTALARLESYRPVDDGSPSDEDLSVFVSAVRDVQQLQTIDLTGSEQLGIDRALASACESAARWAPLDSDAFRLSRYVLMGAATHESPRAIAQSASQEDSMGWADAPRISAAAGLCFLARHDGGLSDDGLALLRELSTDPVRSVRFQTVRHVHLLAATNPACMWTILRERAASETDRGVLEALAGSLDCLRHRMPSDVTTLLLGLLARLPRSGQYSRARESAATILAAIYADCDNADAKVYVLRNIDTSSDWNGLLFALRARLVHWVNDTSRNDDGRRKRAWQLAEAFGDVALKEFSLLEPMLAEQRALSDDEYERFKLVARSLKGLADQLYFASGAYRPRHSGINSEPEAQPDLTIFLADARQLVERLSFVGIPGVAYHLALVMKHVASVEPRFALVMLAQIVKSGEKYAFQADSQAVQVATDVVKLYLATHRALLQADQVARRALLDMLDVFVRAGWPAAHAVTYNLGEIFQ